MRSFGRRTRFLFLVFDVWNPVNIRMFSKSTNPPIYFISTHKTDPQNVFRNKISPSRLHTSSTRHVPDLRQSVPATRHRRSAAYSAAPPQRAAVDAAVVRGRQGPGLLDTGLPKAHGAVGRTGDDQPEKSVMGSGGFQLVILQKVPRCLMIHCLSSTDSQAEERPILWEGSTVYTSLMRRHQHHTKPCSGAPIADRAIQRGGQDGGTRGRKGHCLADEISAGCWHCFSEIFGIRFFEVSRVLQTLLLQVPAMVWKNQVVQALYSSCSCIKEFFTEAWIEPKWPSNATCGVPYSKLQRMAILSAPPVTIKRWSGEMATAWTASKCSACEVERPKDPKKECHCHKISQDEWWYVAVCPKLGLRRCLWRCLKGKLPNQWLDGCPMDIKTLQSGFWPSCENVLAFQGF